MMVATPLPDSGFLKCPSVIFSGKTYQGPETPVTDHFLLCAQNGHDERMHSTECPVVKPSLNTKSVKFDVKKTEFQGNPCGNDISKSAKNIFQRSLSVPVGTQVSSEFSDDFQHEKVAESLKLSICTQTSVIEDAASDPLLQKEINGIDNTNGGIDVRVDSNKVSSDSCVVENLLENDEFCKKFRTGRKSVKKKHICYAVAAVLSVIALAGLACFIYHLMTKEDGAHENSTAKPPSKCSVFETMLNNQAVKSDDIIPKQGYTLPFIFANASSSGVYTNDGRQFMTDNPGWYEVHLTLQLNTFSWIQSEDLHRQFSARLCAICGAHAPHCLTDTLNARERSYISITRKIEFRNPNDRLEFTLTVDNAHMIKESERDNILQIHPMSCDIH